MSQKGKKHLLDNPLNVKRVILLLVILCAVLMLLDIPGLYDKHEHFGFEVWFGFYAIFGFVAFFLIVLAGKCLRKVLKRDENYYD